MKIGYNGMDITPDITDTNKKINLSGYGYMTERCADSVLGNLENDNLVIWGNNGEVAAISGIDTIGLNLETVQKIRDEVYRKTGGGIGKKKIILGCSHTHSGPPSARLYGAGDYDPDFVENILVPRVSDSIAVAYWNMADGEIGLGRVKVAGVSYNREGRPDVDRKLTVVSASNGDSEFALLNYPCHLTVLGKDSKSVSSEYGGAARESLRSKIPKIKGAVWTTGCSGDIDPSVNEKRKNQTTGADVLQMGEAVGTAAAGIYRSIKREESNVYSAERTVKKWLEYIDGMKGGFLQNLEFPITAIRIGKDVYVSIPAEVHSSFGLELQKHYTDTTVISIGNGYEGYIPPMDAIRKGVYSGAPSTAFLFGRHPVKEDAEEILLSEAESLMDDVLEAGPE